MKKILILIGIVVVFLSFFSSKLIFNKSPKVSIAIIKNDKTYTINDKKRPMLSVFKYLVALKVLDDIDKKNISLDKKLTITKNRVDEKLYSPMLKKYKNYPFEISYKELLGLMISQSDNNACDILIEETGGIKEIEDYINKLGFSEIELSVNEKEMNEDIEKQYLNKAFALDIVKILKKGQQGEILSKNSTDYLNRILIETTTGENKLKAGLPKNAIIGHKTGSSSRKPNGIKIADNDTGFVIKPNGEIYYIAVFVEDSNLTDKQNADLIKLISKLTFKLSAFI